MAKNFTDGQPVHMPILSRGESQPGLERKGVGGEKRDLFLALKMTFRLTLRFRPIAEKRVG